MLVKSHKQLVNHFVRSHSVKVEVPKIVTAFINGDYVPSSNSKLCDKIDPSTNTTMYQYEEAGADLIQTAVESSRQAQLEWMKKTTAERSLIIQKISQMISDRNDELSMIESIDTGKGISECLVSDAPSACNTYDWCSKLCHTSHGATHELWEGTWAYTRYEPIGITAGIGAWNYPIQAVAWKAGPAIAAGNSIIFKPAQDTPLTALKTAEIFMECGAPAGLLNVVLGGASTGQSICEHKDIGKISFTGSRDVGKKIMNSCSTNLKRITLELGGKSPLIIFDDCDLNEAVSGAMMGNWFSNGEVCSNCTRVFVQRGVYDAFKQKLLERTNKIIVGHPQEPNVGMGPMINENQYKKVLNYIDIGVNEGASLLLDGRNPPVNDALKNGFFCRTYDI